MFVKEGHRMVYEITFKNSEKFYGEFKFNLIEQNQKKFNHYLYVDKNEKWDVTTTEIGIPVKVIHTLHGNLIEFYFSEDGRVKMIGKFNNESIQEERTFKPGITVENIMVLKNLDFNSTENYNFDLIQTLEYPKLIAYPMYFRIVGNQKVCVKAGEFNCKKILFSLSDMRGLFFRAYYYVTDDLERNIVKIENMPISGKTELISIENN